MTEKKIIDVGLAVGKVLSGEQTAGELVRENMCQSEHIEAMFDKRAMWREISRHTRPKLNWQRHWVAAAAIAALLAGGWWMLGRGTEECSTPTAMLVLDDGREIALKGDTVVTVGGMAVEVVDGKVHCTSASQKLALMVPRGVEPLSVVLDDGSTVCLNSGSQLSYPARFGGGAREVELSGEAFFEVERDVKHPFVVHSGAMTTTVLGTTFNICAYADDPAVETTLIEGSVRVETEGGATQVLTPSMQASFNGGGLIIKRVDAAAVMAWRSGVMELDETDLQQIMRVLSRWYDIDVEYVGSAATQHHNFTARLNRAEGLSRALETLDMLGAPEIEVTEEKLIIHQ